MPRAFGQTYSLYARSLDPTIHRTLVSPVGLRWDTQRPRRNAKVGIFNLSVGLMSTGLSPGDIVADPPRFFFFRFGVSFFHVHLSNPILCRSNDFSRFVQAHERAQAGKCPNTIQATMGSLAMLEKPRCSHRSMDAGSPAGHPWVIGSAQKPRILWANWVREWWTQLDCVFFTDVLMRDSPIAPTSWIELLPTRGGNVVIFVIINVLHLL